MKPIITVIILLTILIVLVGTIGYLLVNRSDIKNNNVGPINNEVLKQISFNEAVDYTCVGGAIVALATATADPNLAEVSLPNTGPIIFNLAKDSTGRRYENIQSGLVLQEEAGNISVRKNDELIYQNCISGPALTEVTPPYTESDFDFNDSRWRFTEMKQTSGDILSPNKPEDFILTFLPDNRFSLTTDCNNAGGVCTSTATNIKFSEMVMTLMACTGDIKEGDFLTNLQKIETYAISADDNALTLSSPAGEMQFVRLLE